MRLNVLTKAVLNPDIQSFISSDNDTMQQKALFDLVRHSLDNTPATWAYQTELGATTHMMQRIMSHLLVNPDSTLLQRAVQPTADKLVSGSGNLNDLGKIKEALRKLVVASVVWQIGKLFGDKPTDHDHANMSENIFRAMVTYVGNVMSALDAKVNPAKYSSLGTVKWDADMYAGAFNTTNTNVNYLDAARSQLRDVVRDTANIPKDIQQWIFPIGSTPSNDGPTVKMFASAMQAFLVFRYFASFVQGSWNLDASMKPTYLRAEVDFYDERYARHLILDIVKVALKELANNESDRDDWNKLNDAYSSLVTNSLTTSRIETGDTAMKAMYEEVSKLSDKAKRDTVAIADQSSKFDRRRGFLQSMRNNLVTDERTLARKKRVFWAWAAAYFAATVVGVGLIALRMNAAFMLHAGIIMLLVVVLALIKVIRAWIGK